MVDEGGIEGAQEAEAREEWKRKRTGEVRVGVAGEAAAANEGGAEREKKDEEGVPRGAEGTQREGK